MNQSHEGRVAIITGAARGIGRAIALKLSKRGAQLVLVDLDTPTDTASEIDGQALPVAADVANASDWVRLAEEVDRRYGRADIVVNNAGIGIGVTIDDLEYDVWRQTLAVNLDAHFYSAKHFVPLMRRNGWGRLVSISSNSIGTADRGLSHYMASKMGVIGFVRGLANDVAADGITVNAVLPALTNTPLVRDIPEEQKRATWQQQAIKRFAEPDDIAGPVCFLTSEDAAFVTGQALVVDGGLYKIS
jgi:3-oxoacyl-[acyl-carrier protein] reductase